MTSRKPKFTVKEQPTIWFKENRIEGRVSLSYSEIEQLAPSMIRLLDQLAASGVSVQIEAEINITIMDIDLYTGNEDEDKADD